MKPLLIIPPAPARWPMLRELPLHTDPHWQADLEKRFAQGLPRSQDAFAVFADGGLVLAAACVNKRHDLGILNRVYVRPEHRRRGLARTLIQTLVSWFEMTGGKWLYTTCSADVAEQLFRPAGFKTIRRAPGTPHDVLVLLRAELTSATPLDSAAGDVALHELSRANWPTMAVLLFNRPGADPRVPLDESAAAAEQTALDLVVQQEAGKCVLRGAFRGPRLVALGSVAADQAGPRTHAMIVPPVGYPPELREALVALAQSAGKAQVDFPMEALAAAAPAPG